MSRSTKSGFNTDDGIWRATINIASMVHWLLGLVSIPMTVFGGLQFKDAELDAEMTSEFQYR